MTESIWEIWKDDRLNRQQDADFLYRFLLGQVVKRLKQGKTASYVVNVGAGWGGGNLSLLRGLNVKSKSKTISLLRSTSGVTIIPKILT